MVFGNPATHSIKHGMFFFSDGRMWRHKMWRKLHDARLIELISYSKEKMVMFDRRKKDVYSTDSGHLFHVNPAA